MKSLSAEGDFPGGDVMGSHESEDGRAPCTDRNDLQDLEQDFRCDLQPTV